MNNSMTFQRFSALNHARCRDGFKHDPAAWSASDWMVATMGELGTACACEPIVRNQHEQSIR